MKIGYDAKRAVSNMTGLGNYSRLVIEETALSHPESTLYLYTPTLTDRQRSNPRVHRIDQLRNVEFRHPDGLGPFGHGSLWRTIGITRHFEPDGLDIYHGLSNELPLNIVSGGIPTVVTIHDLIYRRMPECYNPIDRMLYDFKYGRSARNATRVIAISECTKRDLIELHHVDPERIDVIYQGCDPQFAKRMDRNQIEALRRKYRLPEQYIIQVGTIERRKNLELTVRALPQLPPQIGLVAVGKDNNYLNHVRRIASQLGVEGRLTVLQGIPFDHLPALYQGAEAAVYPSRYEGFGIPVLEALESRRPVVAATGSCLEEAGGEAAFYVSPDDPRELSDTLNHILRQNTGGLEERLTRGTIYAQKFNTRDMTDRIFESYRKAIDDFRRANPDRKRREPVRLPKLPV